MTTVDVAGCVKVCKHIYIFTCVLSAGFKKVSNIPIILVCLCVCLYLIVSRQRFYTTSLLSLETTS